MKPNWPIHTGRQGVRVTVPPEGIVVSLMEFAGDMRTRMRLDVLIDNPGPADVFVVAGTDPATLRASLTSMRVPANSLLAYEKGSATHVAFICAAGGSQTVVVHVGEGA